MDLIEIDWTGWSESVRARLLDPLDPTVEVAVDLVGCGLSDGRWWALVVGEHQGVVPHVRDGGPGRAMVVAFADGSTTRARLGCRITSLGDRPLLLGVGALPRPFGDPRAGDREPRVPVPPAGRSGAARPLG
ncbi:MAG: hypothetical protein R2746_03555 [Acidimicrobiales bacterium]